MGVRNLKLRELLSSFVFIALLGALFVLNIVTPSPLVLEAERRMPAQFPSLSLSTLSSGSFMSKFDDYAADNFVYRDAFRSIHSFLVFNLYMQRDMSGLYRSGSIGIGEFRRLNASAFRLSAQKVRNAAQSLKDRNMNVYVSLIPDKSIFADFYMPGFDLDTAEGILLDELGDYPYIRISDILKADDFYRTDLHWDQSRITGIADYLLASMNAAPYHDRFPTREAGEFYGLYAGQIALSVKADIMTYADIPALRVSYLSERTLEFESGSVYDFERFEGVDPYDFFLHGPQPLIVIENDNAPQRELYLFRDSFGSSLAPLLVSSYSRVTLIDLRYINLMLLDMFIDFAPGSDVLFIYGSQIFNNPSILQA